MLTPPLWVVGISRGSQETAAEFVLIDALSADPSPPRGCIGRWRSQSSCWLSAGGFYVIEVLLARQQRERLGRGASGSFTQTGDSLVSKRR